MKTIIFFLGTMMIATCTTFAGLQDFDITATREKLGMDRGRESGNMTVTSREIRYRIDVKSRAFKPVENVEVKYNIYYEDKQEGSRDAGTLQAKTGSQKFDKIEPGKPVAVSTDPFELTTQKLDGNWYWANGASNKTADRVVGIWARVYVNGELKQEYCNPTTLSKKADWKD
ncbi:MAG: hypothetical protein E6Q40_11195 [Cupriavidus sp.]|nr:MAG: hypothetical protein E6Q40_11195 [Cupriavidus sp.]